MSQTAVSEYRANYVAGQLHNPSTAITASRIAETASAIIPGEVVIKGTLEGDVTGVAAAFTKATFRGIAIWNSFQNEKALSTGVNSYGDAEPIPILRKGVIAVLLDDTVVEGGTGFFVHTAAGDSDLHTWRIDLDTDKASEVPGVYLEDGVAGDIILFELDIMAGIGSILT